MSRTLSIINSKAIKSLCAGLFLFFYLNDSRAQVAKGIIAGPTGYLSGVIVTNCATNGNALSNANGEFQINAKKGDALAFAMFNYLPDTIVFDNQNLLQINLRKTAITLEEVVIKSAKLNPLETFLKNQEDYKKIYRLGNMQNIISLNGDGGSAGIGFNIDALFSALSTQGRNARKLQVTLVNSYHEDIVDSRFTTALVMQVTGYKGKELSDFMINNRPSYEFITGASNYDIIQYIKRRANGVVVAADYPTPVKLKKEGFQIKYKAPAAQILNIPSRPTL